jgi:hypothetical protein
VSSKTSTRRSDGSCPSTPAAYGKAHDPLSPHPTWARGESRSVASEAEDLLAYYLVSRLPSIGRVFINQPLIRRGHPRLKPDLVICRRSESCALVDVKMDRGDKRDGFASTLCETDARMAQLRGAVLELWTGGRTARRRVELRLAPHARSLPSESGMQGHWR